MDNRPIGVFDSGLGGLTTVKELTSILPNEDIIYFGDTSRVPYGQRSPETIKRYAHQDISFLKSKGVKMIVSACGTASSVLSFEDLDNLLFTGVITPTSIAATRITRTKKVGVIGTSATIKSGAFKKAICNLDPTIEVFSQACPLFVPLVENGFTQKGNQVAALVAEQYLLPLVEANIDTLILGCTHYPILSDIIASVMGTGVTLLNSGQEAARRCRNLLEQNDMLNNTKSVKTCEFYVSDTVEDFEQNALTVLAQPITGKVYQIDIEQY